MNRLVGLLRAGRNRKKVVGLTALFLLALGAVAIAAPSGILTPGSGGPQGITTVGPVNPNNGFPDWYRDSNGIDLQPCDDPQDKYCGGAVAAPDNTAPITFPDNFPDEFFYMSADADSLTSAGGNKVLASFALEGAFANPGVHAGDQIVFSRIRYRINAGLQPSTDYKVTQPYGTDTITSDDTGALFVTQDVGVSPGDFAQATKGRVGPFLTWAKTADPTDVPPANYIGDGITPHTVTGSQLGTNFVRIQGPGIGGAAGSTNPNPCNTTGANAYSGPVNDCIQTNNFVLVGKRPTIAGVDVTRATYEKTATGTEIAVTANSKAGQDIVVRDGDNGGGPGRLFRTTPLRADGTGRYMAYVSVPGALPKTVDVVNRGDTPATVKHVDLTDSVTAVATYGVTNGSGGGDKLHVTASSSDSSVAKSALTLPGYGDTALDATGQADVSTPATPDTVTVKSPKGGSVTVPVTISGETLDPLPLIASAGVDQTVSAGAKVTLDGSGSAGDIDSLSWSGPAGITLNGATTANPTFTAPTTEGTLTFTLTVKSGTDTKTATVNVKVNAVTPPTALIGAVPAAVLQNLPITLDGTGSIGAKFEWSQDPTDATKVNLGTDTTSSKLTFLYPKTTTPVHIILRVRSAADTGGACDVTTPTCDIARVTLTPKLDDLGTIRAKNDGKGRWVVDSTSTVLESNNVRVYAGATIDPTKLIGTALVDATGAWKVDVRNSTVAVPACRCVSAESDRGGRQLNVAMQ
jgi:K319L-like, PKD domain